MPLIVNLHASARAQVMWKSLQLDHRSCNSKPFCGPNNTFTRSQSFLADFLNLCFRKKHCTVQIIWLWGFRPNAIVSWHRPDVQWRIFALTEIRSMLFISFLYSITTLLPVFLADFFQTFCQKKTRLMLMRRDNKGFLYSECNGGESQLKTLCTCREDMNSCCNKTCNKLLPASYYIALCILNQWSSSTVESPISSE